MLDRLASIGAQEVRKGAVDGGDAGRLVHEAQILVARAAVDRRGALQGDC